MHFCIPHQNWRNTYFALWELGKPCWSLRHAVEATALASFFRKPRPQVREGETVFGVARPVGVGWRLGRLCGPGASCFSLFFVMLLHIRLDFVFQKKKILDPFQMRCITLAFTECDDRSKTKRWSYTDSVRCMILDVRLRCLSQLPSNRGFGVWSLSEVLRTSMPPSMIPSSTFGTMINVAGQQGTYVVEFGPWRCKQCKAESG